MSSSTNVIIGAGPNHLGTRYASWEAAGDPYSADFPASKLATRKPSDIWRSGSLNPFETRLEGEHAPGDPFFVGSFANLAALVGHNLRLGTGRVRFRLVGGSPSLVLEPGWIAPTGATGETNCTGTYTDVDDDLSAGEDDGNFIKPTSETDPWAIRLLFPTPGTGDMPEGSATDRRQAFIVKVDLAGTGAANLDPAEVACPTIKAELFKNGSLVRDLGTKKVALASSQFLIWLWDGSELEDLAGDGVSVQLSGTAFGTVYVRLRVGGWFHEPEGVSELQTSTRLYADTGWRASVDDLVAGGPFGAFYPIRPLRKETSFASFTDVGIEGETGLARKVRTLQVWLMDDQTPTIEEGLASGRVPVAPTGFLEAGVGWLSQALRLTINRELGDLVTFVDRSVRVVTANGGQGGTQYPRTRIVHLPCEWLSPADAMALVDRICWEGSILSPHVISLLPASSTERRHTTIYGCLMDPENVLRATNNGTTYNRGLTLRFLEWR